MNTVDEFFEFGVSTEDGERRLTCALPPDRVQDAAVHLAQAIVRRRIPSNGRLRDLWFEQLGKAPDYTLSDTDGELLIASVLTNVGTPDDQSPALHLYGLIAEMLWSEVVAIVDTGIGVPIRIEGHDWSVTDPGGDGLTVYQAEGGLFFRLWESKHHLADAPVRDTVNGACRQVRDRSLSYLARFSLIAQQLVDDPELAEFYGRLPEFWVDNDPCAGVGISIGTDASSDSDGCFGNVHIYFDFDRDRMDTHLHMVGDFVGLATSVREELWKGCGLWIAP